MIRYVEGTEGLPWQQLYDLNSEVGLVANLAAEGRFDAIREVFERSFRVVTALADGQLVGAGRLLSDGICYGLIVDVAVLPTHRKRGIGKGIMEALVDGLPHVRIYLTSTFGNEPFYERLGYRKHKTAYALFPGPSDYVEPPQFDRE